MKRISFISLLFILLSLIPVACGGSAATETPTDGPAAEESTVEITPMQMYTAPFKAYGEQPYILAEGRNCDIKWTENISVVLSDGENAPEIYVFVPNGNLWDVYYGPVRDENIVSEGIDHYTVQAGAVPAFTFDGGEITLFLDPDHVPEPTPIPLPANSQQG